MRFSNPRSAGIVRQTATLDRRQDRAVELDFVHQLIQCGGELPMNRGGHGIDYGKDGLITGKGLEGRTCSGATGRRWLARREFDLQLAYREDRAMGGSIWTCLNAKRLN